ncbi:2Fe-2S iron-sulfur cluster-binding protein [Shewanella jiangmenensis]|nr:2Fe-2S iron-sulfur cluster binding domain-containing protein [Shewanella jiangmenensis]
MTTFYLDGRPLEALSSEPQPSDRAPSDTVPSNSASSEQASSPAHGGETLHRALLRLGVAHNYSCTKGVCRCCLVKLTTGVPTARAQKGLEDELKADGWVFGCQSVIKPGMRFETTDDGFCEAVLVARRSLSPEVYELVFAIPPALMESSAGEPKVRSPEADAAKPVFAPLSPFIAGQCVSLLGGEGFGRTYGIADVSFPAADTRYHISLHVRRKRNGSFSQWLCDALEIGAPLKLSRPWGRSHYLPDFQNDELIFVAFGSGIGPAAAVVREALNCGHQKPISLYHADRYPSDLYQHKALLKLMLEKRQFFYQGLIAAETERERIDHHRVQLADVETQLKARHTLGRGSRLFLFGDADKVAQITEYAFLNALEMDRIHAQSFEYRDLRRRPRR